MKTGYRAVSLLRAIYKYFTTVVKSSIGILRVVWTCCKEMATQLIQEICDSVAMIKFFHYRCNWFELPSIQNGKEEILEDTDDS